MRYAFDDLGYRRFEWKCDSLNEPSRRAARRLGFRYEGRFRHHMVTKGRNRDTDWFSVTDAEWPAIRAVHDAGSIRATSTPPVVSACRCLPSPRRSYQIPTVELRCDQSAFWEPLAAPLELPARVSGVCIRTFASRCRSGARKRTPRGRSRVRVLARRARRPAHRARWDRCRQWTGASRSSVVMLTPTRPRPQSRSVNLSSVPNRRDRSAAQTISWRVQTLPRRGEDATRIPDHEQRPGSSGSGRRQRPGGPRRLPRLPDR